MHRDSGRANHLLGTALALAPLDDPDVLAELGYANLMGGGTPSETIGGKQIREVQNAADGYLLEERERVLERCALIKRTATQLINTSFEREASALGDTADAVARVVNRFGSADGL